MTWTDRANELLEGVEMPHGTWVDDQPPTGDPLRDRLAGWFLLQGALDEVRGAYTRVLAEQSARMRAYACVFTRYYPEVKREFGVQVYVRDRDLTHRPVSWFLNLLCGVAARFDRTEAENDLVGQKIERWRA